MRFFFLLFWLSQRFDFFKLSSIYDFRSWVRFCGTEVENLTSDRYNMYASYSRENPESYVNQISQMQFKVGEK